MANIERSAPVSARRERRATPGQHLIGARRLFGTSLCLLAALSACRSLPDDRKPDLPGTTDNWTAYGGTSDETHFSTLTQINDGNVAQLGLAWAYDLPTMISAVGAPLEVAGTVYLGVGYTHLYALDARTGRKKWDYDPEVTKVAGPKLRMGWGVRGIAYDNGKIFAGTQDGRLLAVDAATGKLLWSIQTTEPGDGRTISGAPRTFNGKVIIGNGGADFTNSRGYVTTYDQKTGRQLWRFFVVPGDPAKGFENKAMEMAAKTWTGEWWKWGGGGNPWNAMTYDKETNLVFIGTGNGAPQNQAIRSPGGGDNLFLCSVVALDADTGEYVWHYQINPGETWDYNATMDISLATIDIAGERRKVLFTAPKNGFFYVIDRKTGKLLSAEPYTEQTWASKIDLQNGRPVENPDARFRLGSFDLRPAMSGGHNWHAMSFSPKTGLVYIPTLHAMRKYDVRNVDIAGWKRADPPNSANGYALPPDAELPAPPPFAGSIQAWDPVNQRARWSVPLKGLINGGTATTAGNLLFQGYADGQFTARSADTGKLLWSFDAHNGIVGQPITYMAGGRQYVTVVAGYGTTAAVQGRMSSQFGWDYRTQHRRVLTFVLGGRVMLPTGEKTEAVQPIVDPSFKIAADKASRGFAIYVQNCVHCHGPAAIAGGQAPDLRASPVSLDAEAFHAVVAGGALESLGMPKFDEFSASELEALRHYIRRRADQTATPSK